MNSKIKLSNNKYIFSTESLFFSIGLIFFIILAQKNYLIFHSFIEGLSIIVSASVFLLAWNIRKHISDSFLIQISIGLLFVSILDSFHMLSYHGMNIFAFADSKNPPTQFWIAARYVQVLALILPPLVSNYKINNRFFFLMYFFTAGILTYSIFEGFFPDCFNQSIGLTPFKKISEYLIILAFIGCFYIYYKKSFNSSIQASRKLFLSAIIFSIFSEIFFTFYNDVYDIYNMTGHILKAFVVFFIYKSIIQNILNEPLEIIFKNLKQQKEFTELTNNQLQKEMSEYLHTLFFYRAALDESSIVIITDTKGTIEYVSDSFLHISKLTRAEAIGHSMKIVSSQFHNSDFFKNLWHTILNGNVWRGEIRNQTKENQYYWVWNIIVPYKNKNGDIEKFVSIQQDISELKKQRDYEFKTKKLAAIGELSTKIIHDALNPVSVILGLTSVIQKAAATQDTEKINTSILKIRKSVSRIQEMFADLRKNILYSNPIENLNISESISLHKIVSDSIVFYNDDERFKDVEINFRNNTVESHFIKIRINQMTQILVNLFGNSHDAIKNLPHPWIEITSESNDTHIIIRITDCGHGVPANISEQIFDSLFTTKKDSGGTGLGLSICRDIVTEFGGTLSLNKECSNTQFVITFPTHQI